MNRSFQSIAALLVSLSGAMLAVTWIPADGPRRPPSTIAARRRAATVPCGHVTNGNPSAAPLAFSAQPTQPATPRDAVAAPAAAAPGAVQSAPAPGNFWDVRWMADRLQAASTTGAALFEAPAAKAVTAAFGQTLRPVWPLGPAASPAAADAQDPARGQIEAEYAAAELAAAGRPAQPWVSAWLEDTKTLVQQRVESLGSRHWPSYSEVTSRELTNTYNKINEYLGCQESAASLLAFVQRQHRRVVLREALLRELDQRFLDVPILKERPAPPAPPFRSKGRRIYLAAAEALKSLSHLMQAAAEQLEDASRQDVAELHTPIENGEEKR